MAHFETALRMFGAAMVTRCDASEIGGRRLHKDERPLDVEASTQLRRSGGDEFEMHEPLDASTFRVRVHTLACY